MSNEQDALRAIRDACLERAHAEDALKAARAHVRNTVLTHAETLLAYGWTEAAHAIGDDEHGEPLINKSSLRGLARPALP